MGTKMHQAKQLKLTSLIFILILTSQSVANAAQKGAKTVDVQHEDLSHEDQSNEEVQGEEFEEVPMDSLEPDGELKEGQYSAFEMEEKPLDRSSAQWMMISGAGALATGGVLYGLAPLLSSQQGSKSLFRGIGLGMGVIGVGILSYGTYLFFTAESTSASDSQTPTESAFRPLDRMLTGGSVGLVFQF
jgi:hypothetical protein